jgi:pyruvate ferredoxin oxidoreductase gamma subunit
MSNYLEVRWHGRGGQGTVTGAKTLAEAILNVGKHIQAFPEYGPERRGAPVRVFNRFSDHPIRMHTPVKAPDVVIVVDPTLVGAADLTGGAKDEAIFLINSTEEAAVLRKKLALKPSQKLYIIPATKISVDEIGRALPNVPMLGGFAKAVTIIGIEELLKEMRLSFEGKFPEKIIEGNLSATRRGYEEAKSDV